MDIDTNATDGEWEPPTSNGTPTSSPVRKARRRVVKVPPVPTQVVEHRLDNGSVLRYVPTLSTRTVDHYEAPLETLDDFLAISRFYAAGNIPKNKATNIPFSKIHALQEPLTKLEAMVGLETFKRDILDMIVYFLQRLDDGGNDDMLHTVLYGPPGSGKTTCVNVLADIYTRLGLLSVGNVVTARRSDLIGRYLGETAIKTRKLIESAFGSVLLIDEAYSLGDSEQRDSFSRECLDTLNQFLSEHRRDFVCVIAGYEKDLKERFFKSNPGLERRFPFKFHIPKYTPNNLRSIFLSVVRQNGWELAEDALPPAWFEEHKNDFPFSGGDMQTLFLKTKFAHGRRVFNALLRDKKRLSQQDVEKGFAAFLDNDTVLQRKYEQNLIAHLYA